MSHRAGSSEPTDTRMLCLSVCPRPPGVRPLAHLQWKKQENGLPGAPMYLVWQFECDVVDPSGAYDDPLELKCGRAAVASACRLASMIEQGGNELKLGLDYRRLRSNAGGFAEFCTFYR